MKRHLFFILNSVFLSCAAARAAPSYARVGTGTGGRPTSTVALGAAQKATASAKASIPVTETTTNTVYVPETNVTETTENTYNVEVPPPSAAEIARTNCLMTPGNIWASKIYANAAGVESAAGLVEEPDQNNNQCYGRVSVKSDEIRDIERFFPARYFAIGDNLACGSWIDRGALDSAILDAKKGARVAGTILASVGGAGLGFGATELIGNTAGKNSWYMGQKGLQNKGDDAGFLNSKLGEKEDKDKDWIRQYVCYIRDLQAKCAAVPQPSGCDGDEAKKYVTKNLQSVSVTEDECRKLLAAASI